MSEARQERRPEERSTLWKSLQGLVRIFCTVWFDLKTYGREHVPKKGGVLLISNHQSNLDPMLVAVNLYRSVSFMAKAELFEHGPFSWLIRNLNAFPVRRGEGDMGAIREAIGRLKEGHMLTLFPEGTRTRDGRIGKIQPGIAMLIRRAGVPVIPAVVDGSFEAWPKGKKLFQRYPVRVMYGPPLEVEGKKGEEIVGMIQRRLEEMLERLRERDRRCE